MPRINILPKNIADLIAAGEVVERPSSVIKEFVENSLDAGAKNITVEIMNGGKTYMRVTDNGCGIDKEDVPKAFISHATSKISKVEDLDAIATLGFRGEALASVCAVSKVEMMTATKDAANGTRYIIEGGEEVYFDDVGCPEGTTIIVRDLFYNIPARMKFLKKDIQEGNTIATVLERIALSNPAVSFRFIRDGKVQFTTPGDGELKSAIFAVFGKDFTDNIIPVKNEMNGIRINGYISKPTACKNNRTMQIFFVNNRFVKSVVFLTALEAAYKNSIMVGKYPACVLFVDMPYEAVDVNVHPAKTEVRFFEEKKVFDCVHYGAVGALGDDKSRVNAVFPEAKIFSKPEVKGEQLKISQVIEEKEPAFVVKEYGTPVSGFTNQFNSSLGQKPETLDLIEEEYLRPRVSTVKITSVDIAPESVVEASFKNKDEFSEPLITEKIIVAKNEEAISSELVQETENNPAPVKAAPDFRYIGEAFNTYLMAELEGKLVFIDKHAAHERILFEKFRSESNTESQILLQPITVDLSVEEYSAVTDEENADLLLKAGYDISDFGDRCVKVNACPPELIGDDIAAAVSEIANHLANNIKELIPERLDWIYHSMACRAAIKAGNFTSEFEARKFVELIISRDDIRYCPHGRPVLIELTQKELEKQFKRIV